MDVQEKIAAVVLQRRRLIENIEKLIRTCRILNVPIFITEQYPQGLGPTESALAEALGSMHPPTKLSFSCCGVHGFVEQLREKTVEQIVVVGIEAHVCVLQTALDLHAQGFQVHVLGDAVSSRHETDHVTALERMRAEGVIVSTVEAAIFELLEKAGTPEFKEVSKLIQ